MLRNPATTASLVFIQDRFVSLSKVAEILSTALLRLREVVAAIEQTDTGVIVICDRFSTHVELIYSDCDTRIAVCVTDLAKGPVTHEDAKRAHLAFLLFPLALNLPASYLLWPSSDVHIPRLRFVEGLADSFSPNRNATKANRHLRPNVGLPDADTLHAMISTASHGLQSPPEPPTAHSKIRHPAPERTMIERLADAARPVFSSLH